MKQVLLVMTVTIIYLHNLAPPLFNASYTVISPTFFITKIETWKHGKVQYNK